MISSKLTSISNICQLFAPKILIKYFLGREFGLIFSHPFAIALRDKKNLDLNFLFLKWRNFVDEMSLQKKNFVKFIWFFMKCPEIEHQEFKTFP